MMPSSTGIKTVEVPHEDEMSDDSLAAAMPTPDSAAENHVPGKRRPVRTRKVAGEKDSSTRQAGAPKRAQTRGAPVTKSSKKRAPPKSSSKAHDENETEEVDEFVHSEEEARPAQTTQKSTRGSKAAKSTVSKVKKIAVEESAADVSPSAEKAQPKSKRGRKAKLVEPITTSNQETEAMDIDSKDVDMQADEWHAPAQSQIHGHNSHEQQHSQKKQENNALDSGQLGDASLQERMLDLTNKLQSSELRYRNLKELAQDGATSNFESLQKTTEERAKAAETLIASLRTDLALQVEKFKEIELLRQDLDKLQEANQKLAEEKTSLQKTVTQHQKDLKTISAKLSSARAGPTSMPESTTRVPGSAVKHKGFSAHSENAKEAMKQLLKEDLYGDLTGLLIRDVKRNDQEHEDIFDCIQTGRNGTLRFYLSVQNPAAGAKPPPNYSYSDAEFQYTPVLDENNDQQLISILPDYLNDEICFPRSQAAKFYSRIQDCLTKKFDIVDDENMEE